MKLVENKDDRLGGTLFVLSPGGTIPLVADLFLHVEDQVTLLFLLNLACVDRRGDDSVKSADRSRTDGGRTNGVRTAETARNGRRRASRTRVKAHTAELLRDN